MNLNLIWTNYKPVSIALKEGSLDNEINAGDELTRLFKNCTSC